MICRLVFAAALLGGAAALAHEPGDAAPPELGVAIAEYRGAVRFWADARAIAEREIAAHPNAPLLADDLGSALAYGDGLASAKPEGAERLHFTALRLWAVIAHVLNARPAPIGT